MLWRPVELDSHSATAAASLSVTCRTSRWRSKDNDTEERNNEHSENVNNDNEDSNSEDNDNEDNNNKYN